MKIAFRVDSGKMIGTGHVMRCLTLADLLSEKGAEITFLSRPHERHIGSVIEKRGYRFLPLSSANAELGVTESSWLGVTQQEDAAECAKILKDSPVDLLIVDHYAIDASWESALRPYAKKIFVIDDLANRQHDCDILLDQNFYTDKDTRYQGLVSEKTKIFTGPEYALLRPEFLETPFIAANRNEPIKNILVFFGGADVYNFTGKTIDILAELVKENPHHIAVTVIAGAANSFMNSVQEQCKNFGFQYNQNVNDIGGLFRAADLAIGAGGVTTWERARSGLPAIVIAIADNQKEICRDAETIGLVRYAGDYDQFDKKKFVNVIEDCLLNGFGYFNENFSALIGFRLLEVKKVCLC